MLTVVRHSRLATVALTVGLAACSKGHDIDEFVQACAKTHASQPLCECAAHAAADKLSPELFRAMVYDMQGRKQELDAIAGRMSLDQRVSFARQQFEIMGGCIKDG